MLLESPSAGSDDARLIRWRQRFFQAALAKGIGIPSQAIRGVRPPSKECGRQSLKNNSAAADTFGFACRYPVFRRSPRAGTARAILLSAPSR